MADILTCHSRSTSTNITSHGSVPLKSHSEALSVVLLLNGINMVVICQGTNKPNLDIIKPTSIITAVNMYSLLLNLLFVMFLMWYCRKRKCSLCSSHCIHGLSSDDNLAFAFLCRSQCVWFLLFYDLGTEMPRAEKICSRRAEWGFTLLVAHSVHNNANT